MLSTTTVRHEKKLLISVLLKNFVCRPAIGPKHFDKIKPDQKSPVRLSTSDARTGCIAGHCPPALWKGCNGGTGVLHL